MRSPFGGIRRALAGRAYRTYWLGQIPHVQGIWIHRVAAGWLIFEMTHSPAWLGAIGFAMSAPSLVLSPLAGALCDRIGHRRTSVIATGAGMLVVLATALLTYAQLMTPVLLFGLVLLLAIFVAFEFPARQSLVPVLLDRAVLTEGMALNWAVFNVAFFTGPLIAGVILTFGGAQLAFLTATATYSCMLTALLRLPRGGEPRPKALRLGGLFGDIAAGLGYTLRHPVIPMVIGLQIVVSLLLRPYVDLMPGFAGAVFGRGEQGLAILLAGSGIGALVVSMGLTLFGRERWLVHVFILGAAGSGAALLLFTLTDVFWLGVAVLPVVGGAATAAGIANATLIQQYVEPAFRGRVVSLNMACQIGAPALGSLALGWLAEFVGLQLAVGASSVLALVVLSVWASKLLRNRAAVRPPG